MSPDLDDLRRLIVGRRHRLSIDPDRDDSRDFRLRAGARLRSEHPRLPGGWVSVDSGPDRLDSFTLLVDADDDASDARPLRIGKLPALLRLPRRPRAIYLSGCSADRSDLEVRELSAARTFYELIRPYLARLRHDPALARHFVERAIAMLARHGVHGLLERLTWRVPRAGDDAYSEWVRRHDTLGAGDRAAIRRHIGSFAAAPEIAILVAVEDCGAVALDRFVRSLRDQLYPHWQLWLVPVGGTRRVLRDLVDFPGADPRLRVLDRAPTAPAALNAGLAAATAPWCARLRIDAELAPHALYLLAVEIEAHPDAVMLYCDEDHVDGDGARHSPRFRPRWNPELLASTPYLGSLVLYASDRLRRAGGWREELASGADWDLALEVSSEAADRVRHVPFVLCHRVGPPGSTEVDRVSLRDARRVLESHVARAKVTTEVVEAQGRCRIRHGVKEPPLVSILVPTCRLVRYLRRCMEAIERTSYPRREVLIVDNGSVDPSTLEYLDAVQRSRSARVLRFPEPFNFSAINNLGAAEARGDVLVLMNDDVEAIDADWLTEMVGHALRPDVGAVGAKLYYPDGSIQHAGMVLGLCGLAGHAFRGLVESGSELELRAVREVAAVSAACLAIRAELYRAVGGLDERDLGVAFNDVDLCLALRRRGYRIIWTPHARLYHHESATRGRDPDAAMARRFRREERTMRLRWRDVLCGDPFCNPNLSLTDPLLTPARHRAVEKPWRNF